MYRNVEINVPLFIGIIILITIVTGVLVYGVNIVTNLKKEHNDKINSGYEKLDDMFTNQYLKNEIASKDETNQNIK